MKNKERRLFFILLLTFVIGVLIGSQINNTYYPTNFFSERKINLAAVDMNGNGVAVPLKVEIKYGDGKVLTDIDKLLFWVDTQYSIQTARDVAENITGIDTSKYDIIYSIDSNETGIVGGPSAGASLTIATIAALSNKTIKTDVMMTGTINEDGTIGPIGGVLEKAKAAKEIGAKIFIVPKGQGTEEKITPKENCDEILGFMYCQIIYEKEDIDVSQTSGIAVIEAETIQDAMKYFFE
ncbi:MAG: hypothetical protein PHU12_02640 [Candidatus Aenigmarchaeota archaeon]|nr:hypothetical protein [Candidatus Aenigmarchaeota archaeon]